MSRWVVMRDIRVMEEVMKAERESMGVGGR